MWTGIVIGIGIMLVINYILSTTVDLRRNEDAEEIKAIMIEGNELRAERNEVLSRIADGVNG